MHATSPGGGTQRSGADAPEAGHRPRYGWAGGLGTLWWSWPDHDAAAVLLTQVTPPPGTVFEAFREATEAALGA